MDPSGVAETVVAEPRTVATTRADAVTILAYSVRAVCLATPARIPFSLIVVLIELVTLSFSRDLPFRCTRPFSFRDTSLGSKVYSLSSKIGPIRIVAALPRRLVAEASVSSFLSGFSAWSQTSTMGRIRLSL